MAPIINRLTERSADGYCIPSRHKIVPGFWERYTAEDRLHQEETIRQTQGPDCFEQIALPHLDSVYRAAVALCGRSADAEDLTPATLARALERFDTFQAGTNCKA